MKKYKKYIYYTSFNKKVEYTGQNIDTKEMFNLYTAILQKNANKINKKAEEIEKIAMYEKITIKDKVKQIVNYLNTNDTLVFNNMFNPLKCDNIEVATAFLGVLELSKLKKVDIQQQYLFSDINVFKKEGADFNVNLPDISE